MSSSPAELRPLARADAAAVAELMRELEASVGIRVATTTHDVDDWWRAVDLAHDSWAIVADGTLVAAAWLLLRDGVAFQNGMVRPSARGRGHGTRLLELAEERARELRLPAVRAGALGADRDGDALLRGRGYEVANRYLELAVALVEPPEPPVPAGIRVEAFAVDDARVFHQTIDDAFAANWDFVSTPFEQWYEQRVVNGDMSLSFLARAGDEVAGAIRCDADRRGLGWVGALGVLPPWRGRGVGRALLVRAFRAFWDRGQLNVGLGVAADNAGALHLYRSVGMRTEAEDVIYEKLLA